MDTTHTHRDVYVCEGTCRAVVSKAEYDSGKTHCGTAACSRQGQPFAHRVRCDNCGRIMAVEESQHRHR